jgi:hypothetical protein
MKVISTYFLLAVTITFGATHASASEAASPRAIALQAMSAFFGEQDLDHFREFVAKEAERKNDGPGSLLESLERQPPGIFAKIELDRIIFFDKGTLDVVADEYPNDLWDRLRKRLDSGVGCLAVVKMIGRDRVSMMAFVIERVEETPLIIYADDN